MFREGTEAPTTGLLLTGDEFDCGWGVVAFACMAFIRVSTSVPKLTSEPIVEVTLLLVEGIEVGELVGTLH